MTALIERLRAALGPEMAGPVAAFVVVVIVFGILAPNFLSAATFGSVAFQLPELGLLTLAMLLADPDRRPEPRHHLHRQHCRADACLGAAKPMAASMPASAPSFSGSILAIGVGALSGLLMGLVIAYTKAHPILVSLSMMIFLRGLGEFLTRGGDLSGFPAFLAPIGYGTHPRHSGAAADLHRLRLASGMCC